MGKGGKTQQAQAQSQKKGGQQNPKQTRDKPSRGCCGCIFSLIRKLILLTAISGFLYVATFTGYTFHVKQRAPTLDEFKEFSLESYNVGSERAREYYTVAEKHSKVYYAHFEKEYLPTIQLYTKKYTKLAVEKAGDLKELSVKYFAIAQKQVDALYYLALEKFAEFQSGKKADPTASPTAAPKRAPESKPSTPRATPTAAPTPKPTPKPTQAPTQAPSRATTPKPTQAPQTQPPTTQKAATPKPATKPTEAPKKAAPNSREKKEL